MLVYATLFRIVKLNGDLTVKLNIYDKKTSQIYCLNGEIELFL